MSTAGPSRRSPCRTLALLLLVPACAAQPIPLDTALPAARLAALTPAVTEHRDSAWTLAELLDAAGQQSPRLRMAHLQGTAAEAGVLAARAVDNPQLRASASQLQTTIVNLDIDIELRVPIPNPVEMTAKLRAAQAAVATSSAVVDAERRLVLAEVHGLYYLISTHQQMQEHWQELETALIDIVARTAAGRAQGMATVTDALEAEERLASYRSRQHEADRRTAEAKTALMVHLGLPPGRELTVMPTPWTNTEPQAPEDAIDQGMRQRPELRAALARIEVAEAEVQRAKSRAMPWIDFVQAGAEVYSDGTATAGVQVALSVPIFSPGRGAVRQASAARAAYEAALDQEVLAVAHDITRAVATSQAAQRLLADVDARVQRAADALATPSPDPLQAARLRAHHASTQLEQARARLEVLLASVALRAAIGDPSLTSP